MKTSPLKTFTKLVLLAAICTLFLLPLRLHSQNQSPKSFDPLPDWRPTHVVANKRYVGNAACAECHTEVKTQPTTPMGIALEPVAESRLLKRHKELTFQEGNYSHTIKRDGDRSIYTVSNGKDSVSLPILYAFGQGKAGQTYVLERNGNYIESRVSFYDGRNGLDLTLGAKPAVPTSLEAALGRILDTKSINDCFSCHATGAVNQGQLQLDKMTPGVNCEGCHGAGEKHVTLMKSNAPPRRKGDLAIMNPGHFDTEGQSQFCGSCHRSWIQVQTMGVSGVENVRFQPYRIFNSKCYNFEDKRISCTGCHNPHEELKQEAAYYDAKCMACHQVNTQSVKARKKALICPKSKQNCVSCHMPKTELPGTHFKFTDHQIRIARAGDPYPN